MFKGNITGEAALGKIKASNDAITKNDFFADNISINVDAGGYYRWSFVRYFLYEYNLHLQERSKTSRPKIDWIEFSENQSDYHTVEHIYPQNARAKYWTQRFAGLTAKQRDALRNSLGNLLPLSKPKNSSLSNKPFPDKIIGIKDEIVGYRFGSYAENEVAGEEEWTPLRILDRGIRMLDFMEKRWGIDIGNERSKIELLGLSFVRKRFRN